MHPVHLAFSAMFAAFAGMTFGSTLLGLLALSLAALSLSYQGHPLMSFFMASYYANDLVVSFDKTRYPYKFIVTLYKPLSFTDFYYEYDPANVAFSRYMVKVKGKNGWYKGNVPQTLSPNQGIAGIKEKIYPPGVQNFSGSDIEYIEYTFYLDEADYASIKNKFKNVGKNGKFVMTGGNSVNEKTADSVNWFKYSPSL